MAGRGVQRSERWEVGGQTCDDQLEEVSGPLNVLEAVPPYITQAHALRQHVCDQLLEASIPGALKNASTSLAVDWTDVEAWARPVPPRPICPKAPGTCRVPRWRQPTTAS